MNVKTMEGLVGARTNLNLMNTPFRVFKDARRKGDLATMERAMGYVDEFSDKADEYQAEADKGMEEDAKEAREKERLEREKAIERRREDREKLEERLKTGQELDTVELSEEGQKLLKASMETMETDHADASETKEQAVAKDAIGIKTGEIDFTA